MKQLTLFETPELQPKRNQYQRLNGLADSVIQDCLDQGIDPMLLVAEFQFRLICKELDQWPSRIRKQFVAKLVRKYIGSEK